MIAITDMKFTEVNEDFLYSYYQDPVPIRNKCGLVGYVEKEKIKREIINGRRFVRPKDNIDIVIGMDKHAQNLIGIQYESYEILESQNMKLINELRNKIKVIDKYKNELDLLKQASFLTRLKWLIKGIDKEIK